MRASCSRPFNDLDKRDLQVDHRDTGVSRALEEPTGETLHVPILADPSERSDSGARLRLIATGKLGQVGRRITCTTAAGKKYEADYYPLNGPYVPLGMSFLPLLPHTFFNLKGQRVIVAHRTVVVYMVNPAYGKVTATIQRSP